MRGGPIRWPHVVVPSSSVDQSQHGSAPRPSRRGPRLATARVEIQQRKLGSAMKSFASTVSPGSLERPDSASDMVIPDSAFSCGGFAAIAYGAHHGGRSSVDQRSDHDIAGVVHAQVNAGVRDCAGQYPHRPGGLGHVSSDGMRERERRGRMKHQTRAENRPSETILARPPPLGPASRRLELAWPLEVSLRRRYPSPRGRIVTAWAGTPTGSRSKLHVTKRCGDEARRSHSLHRLCLS